MILFTILKIIGICILVILAILVLMLLVLLFVPVRYRSTGKLSKDDRQVMAKVSWLASAVSAVVQYRDGKLSWAVKVLGIRVLPGEKKNGEKKKQRQSARGKGDSERAASTEDEKKTARLSQKEDKLTEQTQESKKPTGQENKSQSNRVRENEPSTGMEQGSHPMREPGADMVLSDEEKKKSTGTNNSEEDKSMRSDPSDVSNYAASETSEGKNGDEPEHADENKSFSIFERIHQKIAHFFERIRGRFQNIREQIAHISERIDRFRTGLKENRKKAELWKKFYHMDETQVTLEALKTEVKRLIRYLMPTRIRARIHFGFCDPADTGITLGAISAVYGFFPKGIDLEPDFEEQVLEGEWKLRGRVRLVYFVRLALRLLLKKENRVTYRRFRKLRART